jgi:hypothetical protein
VTLAPKEASGEMKLIIDAPQMDRTDLKNIQAALSVVSLVWPVADEHGLHAHSVHLTSVEEDTEPRTVQADPDWCQNLARSH